MQEIEYCSIETDFQDLISPGMTKCRAKFIFEYLGVSIFLAVTGYNDDELDDAELIKRQAKVDQTNRDYVA